jgi:hypothetical protein
VGRIPIAAYKNTKFTAFIRVKVAYFTNVSVGNKIYVLSLLSFLGGVQRVNCWKLKRPLLYFYSNIDCLFISQDKL